MDSIRDIGKNESKWLAHYNELLSYVEEHHQLPDKKKPDKRNLLTGGSITGNASRPAS